MPGSAQDVPDSRSLRAKPRPGRAPAYAPAIGADYSLTVRRGPKVVKSSHPELAGALRALEEALRVVPETGPATLFRREYAPVQQVVARGELRGPRRARGGVDLRGDGSAEAWTGRISKQLVEAEPGETPYAALGRVLRARVGN